MCLGAGDVFSMCICQKGFCIAKQRIKLSSGAEKGLPAETASSITERAEISEAPLSLVKWDRYLLLGY